MIPLKVTDRLLILGDSGSGKTYLATKILKSYPRAIIITPQPDEWKEFPNRVVTLDPETAFSTIQKALATGNVVVVVEDADTFLTRYENDARLRYFLIASRHRRVGWVFIARRTQDMPTLVFKQANKLFLFQTDLPHDLKTYEEFYGIAGEVKGLDRAAHNALFVDRETREKRVIVA